ncbi:hypothetical protein H6S82_11285 [Planktothrix sp. FACHB-1355]|uniref:RNA polymerase sigma factor 70 region 4 type 2 domain-containing protein n=1 Tax=Aerosakkonema funiforme FACHB-1375 TaxID=2949571 RepID=A0A926VH81_9CYAN|nr:MULTISPECIES: sigma factor-like helix-turn-helix DNA-binding protein [Oscillatoriales]MBD2183694.1 hypothetical protein [Aerosakkonema funiforme FACHB-1375]MBD3559442.1 hypothetical protein [Planktothrix sp. FACHB-1355]
MPNFFNKDSIPRLPERPNNIDKFCTYLCIVERNGRMAIEWKDRLYLKRNLELYAAKAPEFANLCRQQDKGRGMALFWMNVALNEPHSAMLALEHLAAYFEASCYQAAKNVWQKSSDRPWEEYLDIARFMIYHKENFLKVLEKYDLERKVNLDTYIHEVLIKTIKSEAAVGRFSPWRLLYKKSEDELKEALKKDGQREPQISKFIFARKYFKKVYLINTVQNPARLVGQKYPAPDAEDFNEIAKCYNAEKLLPSAPHEVSASPGTVTGEQIKEWMELCIKALQRYCSNSINPVSIEVLNEYGTEIKNEDSDPSNDAEWQSFWDAVESGDAVNRTDAAFREEMANIKVLVEKGIQQGKLQTSHQKIPLLYYGVGLTQTLIGKRLGINQTNIGRHLCKYYEMHLLKKLGEISQPTEWVKPYVSGWLVKDYTSPRHSDLIQAALVEALKKFIPEYREILQLRYGENLTERQISARLCINEAEVKQRICKAQCCLESDLLQVIAQWQDKYVKSWLYRFYKLTVYSVLESGLINLSEECQDVVIYSYCQRRNEQQTAKQLNLAEHQVKEKLCLAQMQLRDTVVDWVQENLDISLDREAELSKVNIILQEWLQNLYKSSQGA